MSNQMGELKKALGEMVDAGILEFEFNDVGEMVFRMKPEYTNLSDTEINKLLKK